MEIRPSKNLPSVSVPEQQGAKDSANVTAARQTADATVTRVLEQAIVQNKQADAALSRFGGKDSARQTKERSRVDVEQSVREAANATVRDVEAAANLARSLAGSILSEPQAAMEAQANQESNSVERLLL